MITPIILRLRQRVLKGDRATFITGLTSGAFASLVSIVSALISVKISLSYFGGTYYGVIVAINALVAVISLLNLGLPNIITGIGSQVYTNENVSYLLRRLVPPYLIYLIAIVLVYLGFQDAIHSAVASSVLKDIPLVEASQALTWAFWTLACTMFFSLFSSAFYALHKLALFNLYQALSAIIPLVAILVIRLQGGNLVGFFYISFWLSLFIGTTSLLSYFVRYYRKTDPEDARTNFRFGWRNIIATGIATLSLVFISVVYNRVDPLIISFFRDSQVLVRYSLVFKTIAFEIVFYGLFLGPISPLFAKWFAAGNWAKIKNSYTVLIYFMAIIGGGIALFNLLFAKLVIDYWVGKGQFAGQAVLIFLSIFIYLYAIYTSNYIVYSSFNVKRKITIFTSFIEPSAKLGSTYFLTRSFGIGGTAASVALVAFAFSSWISPLMLYWYSDKHIKPDYAYVIKHMFFLVIPFGIISCLPVQNYLPPIIKVAASLTLLCLYLILSWLLIELPRRREVIDTIRSYREL
ncbi:MAG TPA: hypothetical protein VGK38_15310 [Prolixibacteraceae bacterium]|jgi:O-antigen/teichoic acid export membrane protein